MTRWPTLVLRSSQHFKQSLERGCVVSRFWKPRERGSLGDTTALPGTAAVQFVAEAKGKP